MEELLAQLDNNCFGLALFLSSFFPEDSFLVLSRTKNFSTQKNPPQVQVIVSDKIALGHDTANARYAHEHALYQLTCLWRASCTGLIMRKKIALEKSLVPPKITFLAFQTDSIVTSYLESFICENILLSEKGN